MSQGLPAAERATTRPGDLPGPLSRGRDRARAEAAPATPRRRAVRTRRCAHVVTAGVLDGDAGPVTAGVCDDSQLDTRIAFPLAPFLLHTAPDCSNCLNTVWRHASAVLRQ